MAVNFSQAASAAASSVTITSTNNGDLILVFAHSGTTTVPTLASGYTNIDSNSTGGFGARIGYKVSTGGDTSSGTWTNAARVVVLVYTGTSSSGPVGKFVQNTGTSTTISYPALTLNTTNGSSWVAGVAGSSGTATGFSGNTTALTNRTSISDKNANGLDTNSGITSFSAQSLTISTSENWIAWSIEILAQFVFDDHSSDQGLQFALTASNLAQAAALQSSFLGYWLVSQDREELPAGSLFIPAPQFDEDFWINAVAPIVSTFLWPQPYIFDIQEPAGNLFIPPTLTADATDYWINPVSPVVASFFVRLPVGDPEQWVQLPPRVRVFGGR